LLFSFIYFIFILSHPSIHCYRSFCQLTIKTSPSGQWAMVGTPLL
jgi:hypothetical protein